MSDYYRQLQEHALAQANGDKKAAASLIHAELEADAHSGSTEALGILDRAALTGVRKDLDDFCRSEQGRLALTIVGLADPIRDSVPAGKSVHRRTVSGEVEQLELTYLDMLFGEIRQKLTEMGYQRDRLYKSIVAAARFLELETSVPAARTPREALASMNITAEDWLAQARAI